MDIMNLAVVMQHPDQCSVVWHEPKSGVDGAGSKITVNVRSSVSIAGAIAIQRDQESMTNPETLKTATDLNLLRDFMTTNWAFIAPKETD